MLVLKGLVIGEIENMPVGLNSPVLTADVVLASEADALIDKLKCCGNCKHIETGAEGCCRRCDETVAELWEMRE
jgi:hypothetical protein